MACHDLAIALGTPFISGKDSLNNEFRHRTADGSDEPIAIPPSLLISAIGQVDDVARCVTMDLKEPGNLLFIVGPTRDEMGGSHFIETISPLPPGEGQGVRVRHVPQLDPLVAKKTFAALHGAIHDGLVRSCHDLSEGGLAVAVAEMAFAGGLGAYLELEDVPFESTEHLDWPVDVVLFSESNTRFLCEVPAEHSATFEASMAGVTHARIGEVSKDDRLVIHFGNATVVQCDLAALKEAWQEPLRW